jgi:hypothetical protein
MQAITSKLVWGSGIRHHRIGTEVPVLDARESLGPVMAAPADQAHAVLLADEVSLSTVCDGDCRIF